MPEMKETSQKMFETAEELSRPEISKIQGNLPPWLKGTYIRSGPGKFDFENDFTVNHWLDGYAILSKFIIDGSKPVEFEKKFLESDAYRRAVAAQKPVITEFATKAYPDPNKGFFSRVVSSLLPEFTDNDYCTPFMIANDLFVTSDTSFFRKVDMSGLTSHDNKYDSNKYFKVNGQSAHPVVCPYTGDLWNVGFTIMTGLKYHFYKMPGSNSGSGASSKEILSKAVTVATIPCRFKTMIGQAHSFGMTKKYLIFVEQPFGVSVSKLAASLVKGDTCIDWLEWKGETEACRFYIVDKDTGKVFKTEFWSNIGFYYMHFINCYEEDGQIIIDINTYKSPRVLHSLFLSKLRQSAYDDVDLPSPKRYVVPIVQDVKEVTEGVNLVKVDTTATAVRKGNQIILTPELLVNESGMEMPTMNKKYYTKKHNYFYGCSTINPCDFSHSIIKIDLSNKKVLVWKESEDNNPGEPIFVVNPEGKQEDDGILISAVTVNKADKDDFLLFLNAKDLKEIARVAFKSPIPLSCHGILVQK